MKKVIYFSLILSLFLIVFLFFSSCNVRPYLRIALLSDNINLNYIDEPNFLALNIFNLVCPSLFYYDDNYLPKSKVLQDIPSLDNQKMNYIKDSDSVKTIIVINKGDLKKEINLISLNDILQTPSLFSVDLLSKRWIYKQNFSINKMLIFGDSLRIEYNDAYSLPYFPYPIILISKYFPNYQQQILDFVYKDKVNFDFLTPYSSDLKNSDFYQLKDIKNNKNNDKNTFTIYNQKNKRLIEFIGYRNYEDLNKEIFSLDLVKLDPKIVNLIKIPKDFQVKILPNENIFFILFNPKLNIQDREVVYYTLRKNLSNKLTSNYTLYSYYLLYNHFALYDTAKVVNQIINKSKELKLSKNKLQGVIIYRNFNEKMLANLITDTLRNNFNFEPFLFNLSEESSNFSLENYVNLGNYDFVIISVNLKPYFNYSKIYNSKGIYNFYKVNVDDDLVDKIIQGYSYNQKQYLIELQKELINTFYILPLLIDAKAYIIGPNFNKKATLLSSDYIEIY
jgi:hypothetical protein